MFELFVVACVAMRACEYTTAPITYPTEARCAQQAAILAGMARGRHGLNDLTYEHSCRERRQVAVAERPTAGRENR